MIEKLQELEARLAYVERLLNMTARVGEVVARDDETCRVKVQFRDADDMVTYWCFVVLKKTHIDKEYWLPDVGETVLCIFPWFDEKHGYVVGAVYNQKDIPPTFAGEGQYILHDKSKNLFLMNRADKQFYFFTDRVNIVGDLVVTGTIYAGGGVATTGNIVDALGDLTNHTHPETDMREADGTTPQMPEVSPSVCNNVNSCGCGCSDGDKE